jgi:hypothetical protein
VNTEPVTEVVKGMTYIGKPFMFVKVMSTKVAGNNTRLSTESSTMDPQSCGTLFEYLIGKYLVKEKEFNYYSTSFKPEDRVFWDEKYGTAAWDLIKSLIMEEPTKKLLEQPLDGYGVTGRADCIIQRQGQPSIIIDFKWTEQPHTDPSPRYALQLLLYQWMLGQQYKEKEGADMYLIMYCDSFNTMQLLQFKPPAWMAYPIVSKSVYKPSVVTYDDICGMFDKWYMDLAYLKTKYSKNEDAFLASLKGLELDEKGDPK